MKSIAYSVLAVSVGIACMSGLAAMKQLPPKLDPVVSTFNVQVFEVQPADLQEIIIGYGTVRAEHDVTVSAQVTGQVATISQYLKVGESVEGPSFTFIQNDKTFGSQESSGDELVWIDRKVYVEHQAAADTAVAEAEAEQASLKQEETNNTRLLNKATADYQIALREHKKAIELEADGSITQSQLAKSELDLQRYQQAKILYQNTHDLFPKKRDQLAKRIERLNGELKLATIEVDRTIVRPPFSGILSEVMTEKGQYVTAGAPLFRVTNVDKVEIAIPLHAEEFLKVATLIDAEKQPLVRLAENESAPARWTGRVVRIAPEADSVTRTLAVYVEVDNTKQSVPLLPGTFVQARIDGPILENAVVVPRDAILGFERNQGSVLVAKSETPVRQTIQISRRIEGLALVEGLVAGDQVVMSNLDVLTADSKIVVQQIFTLEQELAGQFTVRFASPE
jgi:RND family efflux transporter MFP subunit